MLRIEDGGVEGSWGQKDLEAAGVLLDCKHQPRLSARVKSKNRGGR
jgi:hypothetical protein